MLEQSGYVVSTCSDLDEFVRQFLDGDFDVVMLCGTLRREERQLMTNLVHRFSRTTPVIAVCTLPGERVDGVDHICSGEPDVLLAAVSSALKAIPKPPAASVVTVKRQAARARQ